MTDDEVIKLAERAAEELAGSCRMLESLGEEFEGMENNQAFANRLDELVFCCTRCDWWCEQSEMSEFADSEFFCSECEDD